MGRLDPIYTPEQKEEAIRLVIEEGLSAKDAQQRLAQGSNGLPPFNMPWETIRSKVKAARLQGRTTLADGPMPEAVAALIKEAVSALEVDFRQIKTLQRKGEADPDRLDKAVKTLAALDKLVKTNSDNTPEAKPKSPLAFLDTKQAAA